LEIFFRQTRGAAERLRRIRKRTAEALCRIGHSAVGALRRGGIGIGNFLAEIPEGKMVRITVADRGNILDGCRASIKAVVPSAGGPF
jgi:hypothetical protein